MHESSQIPERKSCHWLAMIMACWSLVFQPCGPKGFSFARPLHYRVFLVKVWGSNPKDIVSSRVMLKPHSISHTRWTILDDICIRDRQVCIFKVDSLSVNLSCHLQPNSRPYTTDTLAKQFIISIMIWKQFSLEKKLRFMPLHKLVVLPQLGLQLFFFDFFLFLAILTHMAVDITAHVGLWINPRYISFQIKKIYSNTCSQFEIIREHHQPAENFQTADRFC